MAGPSAPASTAVPRHSAAFRRRRALNWFPMGLTYAFLYMGRYNLTVAKTSLGDLMTKEDFGIIFGVGTLVYALAFVVNGPLVDHLGGRKGILAAAFGAGLANLAMGLLLLRFLTVGDATQAPIVLTFSALYGLNMYFQAFGAVSIVKVNAHWFHVGERGGFSGIFGTMISSGIFLAFTINYWLLDVGESVFEGRPVQWIVFLAPAIALGVMGAVEFFLLRDRPSHAGYEDFDTGDADAGADEGDPIPTVELLRRILGHPVILTVAAIEFCTGVLRNGVMHWFPIYAKEIWALPRHHPLIGGHWSWTLFAACAGVSAVSWFLAHRAAGGRRGLLLALGALAFLAPFAVRGGWGGMLFAAGVIGGNVAGWVSDLVFQSRRAPTAGLLYATLAACVLGMAFTLAPPGTTVAEVDPAPASGEPLGLQPGDRILAVAGQPTETWAEVTRAVRCFPASCRDSHWDPADCVCSSKALPDPTLRPSTGRIPATIERAGERLDLSLVDPMPVQRAGDQRRLPARPVLPMSPYWLGVLVFLVSLCVIGTHGLLSGTATMDFGGRRGAATAVGVIDGFVYLGTAVQSFALGWITTRDWAWWPWFLLPFSVVGVLLLRRIWDAKPRG